MQRIDNRLLLTCNLYRSNESAWPSIVFIEHCLWPCWHVDEAAPLGKGNGKTMRDDYQTDFTVWLTKLWQWLLARKVWNWDRITFLTQNLFSPEQLDWSFHESLIQKIHSGMNFSSADIHVWRQWWHENNKVKICAETKAAGFAFNKN